jgi:hypothetical protein
MDLRSKFLNALMITARSNPRCAVAPIWGTRSLKHFRILFSCGGLVSEPGHLQVLGADPTGIGITHHFEAAMMD